MCHPISKVGPQHSQIPASCPAKALSAPQRQVLAVEALAGTQTVSQLATDYEVSRPFIYRQTRKAQEALDQAFAAEGPADEQILFQLPVTKAWLKQLVLGLALIGHSSYRGVGELLRDLFDCPISIGTIHAILQSAVPRAEACNARQDLTNVRIGAHDEIFQAGQPVLVGADVASTFCYLLSLEEHRDAETWGIRLLELQDRGFHPQATIADFAKGLRAGQELALPEVPCRGDLFHLLQELQLLLEFLENRAYDAIADRSRLEHQQAEKQCRHGRLDAVRSPPEGGARISVGLVIAGHAFIPDC